MPFFSIIIPTFNRGPLLDQALSTVFTQTFSDYEVLVIDDGSTDDSLTRLERYGERLRVFQQGNQGAGAARNLGIAQATGRYVVFLDSDDVWFPWTLKRYHQAIQQNGEPALVMGTAVSWKQEKDLDGVADAPLQVRSFQDYLASASTSFVRTACVVAIRTETLQRVGGFTPLRISSEDHDLLLRLGTEPGFLWIQSPPVTGYRQHEGSSSTGLERGYQGLCYQLKQEQTGHYPGGASRRGDRLTLILHSARHVSQWLTKQGRLDLALDVYRRSLRPHLEAPRWRYLLGFLPWALVATLRRCTERAT